MLTNWALHTLVSSVHSICAQGKVFFQCRICNETLTVAPYFLHPQHKPSGVKYAYQTYFIYIQSSNMKSIFCHPGITRYSQNRPHFKDIFSQKEEDLRAKGLMRTSILEWFLLKVFNVKYFQRTSSKWPWMSKLKISWIVTIWTKNVQSHFCCPPRVPDEYRGDFKKKKRFPPRQRETSKKKKKREEETWFNSLSGFKSSMKPNLSLKHGDVLIWKPQTASCMLTRTGTGRWKGDVAEHNGP